LLTLTEWVYQDCHALKLSNRRVRTQSTELKRCELEYAISC
jgi:hypothetical protein